MRKIFILPIILLMSGLFGSCDYLNVDEYFEDTFKEDSIFANKVNIEKYYNGAVALLPKEGRLWHWGSTPGVTGSDEAVSCGTYWNGILDVSFSGTDLTMDKITFTSMGGWDWNFNVWSPCYKVVRKANTILSRLDEVPMNSFDKAEFRAKVRFLRAYAYYWILQNHGPFIILGEDVLDVNGSPQYYAKARNTYDECIDYICSEFEASAEGLPLVQPIDLIFSPGKGAALALVARLRLQAASPLFNGGNAARKYYGDFIRKTDNVHYISQEYDEQKWAKAAAAAKKVMDLHQYELYTVNDGGAYARKFLPVGIADYPNGPGGIDPYRSYSEIFNGEAVATTNKELIWGTKENINGMLDYIFPIGYGGSNAISVPQRMIDMFYMVDGRRIDNASTEFPYENRPYDPNCIVTEDKVISPDNYTLRSGTYKAYDNREPRFYANIAFSHAEWLMASATESGKHNIIVNYYQGANCGRNASNNGIYNITGYTCRKYVHPRDAKSGEGARVIQKTFPIIRYAEILLSYAEALNNLTTSHTIGNETFSRDVDAIKQAFNPVRYRAGLPGLTDADVSTAETFNEIIQRERCIELFHEGRRFYDVRRWGIVEELEREPLTGLNVDVAEWKGFYAPIIIQHSTIRERTFKPKMILLPLTKDELRKVPALDQNPGWEY